MGKARNACNLENPYPADHSMPRKIFGVFKAISDGRFIYLVVVLLLYLLVSPIVENFYRLKIAYYLFLIAILFSSLLAISQSRTQTLTAAFLAVPMTVVVLIAYLAPSPGIGLAANTVSAIFMLYIIVAILKFVFQACRVTHHVIFAAVAAYLLIGIFWSLCYTIMGALSPTAFRFPDTVHPSITRDFTYFSFVTITTLGYGDITPASDAARAMAFVEALIGQIYMTVLIAWLVGIFVSQRIQSDHDN